MKQRAICLLTAALVALLLSTEAGLAESPSGSQPQTSTSSYNILGVAMSAVLIADRLGLDDSSRSPAIQRRRSSHAAAVVRGAGRLE